MYVFLNAIYEHALSSFLLKLVKKGYVNMVLINLIIITVLKDIKLFKNFEENFTG